jgi:hypothetical protein
MLARGCCLLALHHLAALRWRTLGVLAREHSASQQCSRIHLLQQLVTLLLCLRQVLLPTSAASPAGSALAHFGRAGVLAQGLLLELPSGAGNRLQVSLEGHEGLLPKLDLFWLIRWGEG